ncbi:GMC family oxidoreductase [Jannaschia sp. W003]|uniref:GMC family oxidoreductase n=1 Tax=Jannaschia sp. W003 TaxID=2867012 RepID=UPI0021A69494|nr:GMC oxidoreductase [Jannaschia sp. W003]UWQ21145.1 GMC family oxidoreductase N-terminal domain-containing protein [Jannaschia sp. W003]
METHDILVVGGGAAGATLAGQLSRTRDVVLLEAGPGDRHPLVSMPFGLVWLMGSRRDWRYRSAPQTALGGRRIAIPRGRMLGGSASINSMVWFRGRRDDYDAWGPGWGWDDVAPAFEAVEREMRPGPLPDPHPLGRALAGVHGAPPDPERVSSGPFRVNMERGRRRSPVRAFLAGSPARVVANAEVAEILVSHGRATGVRLADGRRIGARAGVVLCAGAIGSPTLLLRAGLGGPGVGRNLHDHPGVMVHHEGPGSGRGLTLAQMPLWAAAPFDWMLRGRGPLASNTVEAGAFLPLRPGGPPEVQVHFLPCRVGHGARAIGWGAGYYADVCVMRPRSRGRLTLDAAGAPVIDLGLLTDPADRKTLRAGLRALRRLLATAPFGRRRAPEVCPGPEAEDDAALDAHIDARAGTAYHPVGTCALGDVCDPRLRVRGVEGLWVADASVMPRITSANTNAPSIMIGWRGARIIEEDTR